MPLGRYFAYVGSLLLALLFLADWTMPKPAATPARADIDRTIIRLHSLHKWPERIVIDTSLPTIVPPAAIAAEVFRESPPKTKSPKDAFALAMPEAPAIQAGSATVATKAPDQDRANDGGPRRQLRDHRIPR